MHLSYLHFFQPSRAPPFCFGFFSRLARALTVPPNIFTIPPLISVQDIVPWARTRESLTNGVMLTRPGQMGVLLSRLQVRFLRRGSPS